MHTLYIVKIKNSVSKYGNKSTHYKFLILHSSKNYLRELTKLELKDLNVPVSSKGLVRVNYSGSHYEYFKQRITNYKIIMEI